MGGIVCSPDQFTLWKKPYRAFSVNKLEKLKTGEVTAKTISSVEGLLRLLINFFTGIDSKQIYSPINTIICASSEHSDVIACDDAMSTFNQLPRESTGDFPLIVKRCRLDSGINYHQYILQYLDTKGHVAEYELGIANDDTATVNAEKRIEKIKTKIQRNKQVTLTKPYDVIFELGESIKKPSVVFNAIEMLQSASYSDRTSCSNAVMTIRSQILDTRIRVKVVVDENKTDDYFYKCYYWLVYTDGRCHCLKVLNQDRLQAVSILEKDTEDVKFQELKPNEVIKEEIEESNGLHLYA